MPEKRVGPKGKVVSVYLSFDNIELIDNAGAAFGLKRSEVLSVVIESKRDELIAAIARKTNSLSGGN